MTTRNLKIIGIILIILGIFALSYERITYKEREKVVDLGPIEITTEKEKPVPMPLIIGGIIVVAGVILLLMRSKKI